MTTPESVSCGRFRPPAGGRGTFPHGKVPKGCRGRPKGACLVAAPGPPVAKEQCTASLAGARPAGFTSVPGRATVAYKVGFHFVKAKSLRDPRIRLWRKRGLAQLIPPPAPGRRFIPRVVARSRCGRKTFLRYVPWLRCRAKGVPDAAPDWLRAPGQTEGMPDTAPVGRETRESSPFATRGSGGIPRPFEGGIGGQGGIGGGRNPPLPPWPAEPRSNRKIISQNPIFAVPNIYKNIYFTIKKPVPLRSKGTGFYLIREGLEGALTPPLPPRAARRCGTLPVRRRSRPGAPAFSEWPPGSHPPRPRCSGESSVPQR